MSDPDGVVPVGAADDRANLVVTTPVAVIGMACRLPGGIESPEKLWDALLAGDDMVTEVPLDRWAIDDFYDPEPGAPGRTASKWGAFLDDVAGFDSDFFGINEREATAMDPQHRLLLETSWEAMEHAGLTPGAVRDSSTSHRSGGTSVTRSAPRCRACQSCSGESIPPGSRQAMPMMATGTAAVADGGRVARSSAAPTGTTPSGSLTLWHLLDEPGCLRPRRLRHCPCQGVTRRRATRQEAKTFCSRVR